ncbi:A disintegrin and metalloproteinase with thrombospondin motifs 16-like [Antedon mediterranea]|uniref:A disintegrin and metalloproteinase with thrombospondin motifs 16-like n=1 Tax=Antedon mediterranea TaxID=105859 RepID=UPI003AF9D852
MVGLIRGPAFTLLVAYFTLANSKAINDMLTEDSMKRYFSVSSLDEVPEYEIIGTSHGRRRRSIDGSEYPDQHEVKFTAFGEDYHIKLWKNKALIPPGTFAEYAYANGTVVKKPLVNHCHYLGEVHSHDGSRAAISTCKGLSGMFSHGDSDVYIQPLQEDHAEKLRQRRDIENPHVIYRRSAGDIPNGETEETREMKKHVCGNDKKYYHDENNQNEMAESAREFVGSDDEKKATRTKRQTSGRHLELLVVTDWEMRLYHGAELEDYTLTLMNIVAGRYADPSVGTRVNLYITRFILFDAPTIQVEIPNGGTASLDVTQQAEHTLPKFCDFQRLINPASDSDPTHWDNALLISRFNLELYGNNNLLGIARLWGACTGYNQCSLNEESGLASGLTITHEIGHNLGVNHDDGNQCQDNVNIMGSSRVAGPGSHNWSTCSKDQLNNFFGSSNGACTRDVPSSNLNLAQPITNDLPGLRYSADRQCELVFGSTYKECERNPYPQNGECAYLWCALPGSFNCFSSGSAKMDGTSCGYEQICKQGSCEYGADVAPTPVDGGWSPFQPTYGECSRPCGGGVQYKYRFCNNPAPAYGGEECQGDRYMSRICNSEPCETATQEDFRNEQCASTNNVLFNNQFLEWKGFTIDKTDDDLCNFLCTSTTGFNVVQSRGDYFIDGTRCDVDQPNSNKYCVMGKCIEFGCDGEPYSNAIYDKCGVCRGTGVICSGHSGTFTRTSPPISTYFKILTIAVGATSVKIITNLNNNGHIALKINNQYIIGGDGALPAQREYKHDSQSFYYDRSNGESITIPGPTTSIVEIDVYTFSYSDTQVNWEYYLPNGVSPIDPEPEGPTYQWTANEYTECSATCGHGQITRIVACTQNNGVKVDDSFCNGQSRPSELIVNCFIASCVSTYQWSTTNQFTECSVTCGVGQRTKEIVCTVGNDGEQVQDSYCNGQSPPIPVTESCNLGDCVQPATYYWDTKNQFTECSATCGQGTRTRVVVCTRNDGSEVDDSFCNGQSRPTITENCNIADCPQWFTKNQFTECSVTCGQGTRSKIIVCLGSDNVEVHGTNCNSQPRPTEITEVCNEADCSNYPGIFYAGNYGSCSKTCGGGVQTRGLFCVQQISFTYSLVDESNCDPNTKPMQQRNCNEDPCTSDQGVWVIGEWSTCSKSCGGGVRSRTVDCKQSITSNIYFIESECPSGKPSTQEQCNIESCPTLAPSNPGGMCNVVLTNQNARIVVGNTNGEYCNTTIVAPVDQRIVLTFVKVDVDCANGGDFIVKDGRSGYRVCSVQTNSDWPRSNTNVMEISGKTLTNAHGYEISFRFETVNYQNDGCDSVYTSEIGSLSSPNYPSNYPANTDCSNYIVAPPGKRISISFTAFDIEYHPRCGYDNVRINDFEAYYTVYYCNYRNPFTWVSTTNKVQVQFHSDPALEKSGFLATYTFV